MTCIFLLLRKRTSKVMVIMSYTLKGYALTLVIQPKMIKHTID